MQLNPSAPDVAAGVPTVPKQAHWLGWTLALVSTTAFSMAPPIARAAIVGGINPTTLVMLRLLLATLFAGLTIAIQDRRLFRFDRFSFLIAAGAGAMNGIGMLLFFWGLARVDASMASMIISLSPLTVLSLLALRGERFTHRHTVRLVFGLAGVYLLIGPGGHADQVGVLLLLLSVLFFSVQMALLQWYLRAFDARTITFYISAAMAFVVTTYWLVTGVEWHMPETHGWVLILALAFVCTYVARWTFVAAIGILGSGQMAMFAPLETLLTVTWSMLFLDEWLTPLQWLGGSLVMVSALLAIQRLGTARWRPRWRVWSKV